MRICNSAGDILRIEMVRCGYTLRSLSGRTGISTPVLRNILVGRAHTVSIRTLHALALAFGYSMSDWVERMSRPITIPADRRNRP